MIAPCCNTEATAYEVRDQHGERQTVYECVPCRRRRIPRVDGDTGAITWLWLGRGGFCADCRKPIWRYVAHPVSGQHLPLWPRPSVTSVSYALPEGGRTQPLDY